ncbi:MAG TPA: acetylxylan esterase [Fimbriimonadaceae bacterium]|nr:acetylxylan esterase [Fimbriimonadaceae bacterium]
MLQLALLLLCAQKPLTPVDFGNAEIAKIAGERAADVKIEIKPTPEKESFRIAGDGQKVTITASDQVGAMYGAFEFAERLRQHPGEAWSTKFEDSPYLPDRGLNLFLTLPWDYKKNDTDYDVAALTDPNRWWFANEDYWKTLLDTMAKSRLNWLDIHGGWDISVTNAPNLYAYFVTSRSFPKVGVPDDVKAKDLAQLNHVIEMAHERGIRVSLMCYEANLKIPQNPNPPYQATEQNIYKYTKEVVEQMIRKAPGLDAIGYRIGESGHGENFFTCYGEAIKASGRDIPIVTRSWITRKQKVLPLARASKDFTVEIKYNGEQWGAPYMVAGGRMANWHSYSYEDYLSDSENGDASVPGIDALTRVPSPALAISPDTPSVSPSAPQPLTSSPASPSHPLTPSPSTKKLWTGWPAEGGGNWPSEPYKIVWQVRANGTHRIFPFYNPEWVRRSILAMKIGTASGYTIEGEDAYYPKSPDYYMADPAKDKYCDWLHQRDEMYWTTWGRLGYDPNTPDATFDAQAAEMLGANSAPLVQAWKEASVLLSKAFMAYALGPDHRDNAPELEWDGDTEAFIQGAGLDAFSFQPINETYANVATGGIDGRISLYDVAKQLEAEAEEAQQAVSPFAGSSEPRVREIANTVEMMALRAQYFANRFYAANSMAAVEGASGEQLKFAETEKIGDAATDSSAMASNPFYRPFTERLRMHTNDFAWKQEDAKVVAEAKRLDALPPASGAIAEWEGSHAPEDKADVKWASSGSDVVCTATSESADRAWLLIKPLPSSTFFHRVPMERNGQSFTATFRRENYGHAFAVEFTKGNIAWRRPNPMQARPYLIVPSLAGPTPQIYNSGEALGFLDPKILTPDKFGGILIGSRADNFFRRFNKATQRKLLDPVARGMRMVILQEDFAKDRLDFLPKPLRFENANLDEFDPGGQLGLDKVSQPGIIYQRFLPSAGWDVYGNGGLARMVYGKGEIWVTSARFMQFMQMPSSAKAFVKLLSLGGETKPTVLVDACSEGSVFTSSCHQDLMNSHNIPFQTLGEAIAQEQGMNSFTVIPGPTMDDDVLNGKGQAMANKFLRDRVIALSTRPTPPNLVAFEKLRVERKKELMKSLGLDPMPPKTPLDARITGTIQRNGYHIEKLVFESRPKFYVTGHVYVPDGPHGKLPVIVNVNGHWAHKKDEDRIQLRCAFQATQGYIAIAIDSPGWSFEGNNLIERRAEGNHNDWDLVEGGSNTTGYYVWDAIRALDYMATRPDTDMKHVGLTGASGGGLTTLYTFAADDRYSAAVPVVYMASLQLAPDNGCLCNHVPGTCQIGDRSDVIAIQAPKPVYIMGAQNDGEFPPDATRLTAAKMKESWKLFGKDGDVYVQIFGGGHDYNQLMREASIGFFDKYLKGQGDGSPVPQPHLEAIDPEDHQLLALDPPMQDERTMRDLSLEYLARAPEKATAAEAIAINGGCPAKTPLNYKESGIGQRRVVTFESEPGLTTPGILLLPKGKVEGVIVFLSDSGKAAELAAAQKQSDDGNARLYIDALGTGELSGIELRYPIYAGRSVAFTAGWQAVCAAEAMRKYSRHVQLVGHGPMSSQAVMYAGLLDSSFEHIFGMGCLSSWADVFKESVDPIAVQPRAHLLGSLENLRKLVKNATWLTGK